MLQKSDLLNKNKESRADNNQKKMKRQIRSNHRKREATKKAVKVHQTKKK